MESNENTSEADSETVTDALTAEGAPTAADLAEADLAEVAPAPDPLISDPAPPLSAPLAPPAKEDLFAVDQAASNLAYWQAVDSYRAHTHAAASADAAPAEAAPADVAPAEPDPAGEPRDFNAWLRTALEDALAQPFALISALRAVAEDQSSQIAELKAWANTHTHLASGAVPIQQV